MIEKRFSVSQNPAYEKRRCFFSFCNVSVFPCVYVYKRYKVTEQELVRRCKKHDIVAQEALYKRFSGVLFGICLRYCGNRDDANDLLQDVFIRIFDRIRSFKGEGSLEGWMKVTCVRQALNYLRKENRIRKQTDHLDNRETKIYQHPFATEDLIRSLQTLSPNERMIFNLREIEGYEYHEIVELTNFSEGQARVCLHRAKKKLRTYWEKEWV